MVEYAAWVGLDWGREKHAVEVVGRDQQRWTTFVDQTGEGIRQLADRLRREFGGQPVAVGIEQGRGAVLWALMQYEFLHLIPLNPRAVARFREAIRPSGATDDMFDASAIREFIQKHGDRLQAWAPDDSTTRELRRLVEWRRKLVNSSTALSQQLQEVLLEYYPQALDWMGELKSPMAAAFLRKWPTLDAVKRSRPDTIRAFYRRQGSRSADRIEKRLDQMRTAEPLTADQAIISALSTVALSLVAQLETTEGQIRIFDRRIETIWNTHPDQEIFASFPGSGPNLGPRLAVAFGTDRNRWAGAASLQCLSGIAPIIEQSGKQRWVHSRWQCPKFLRQSFHEFAGQSIKYSLWARAFYDEQRRRGRGHHAAVRALAFRWIRILFRCWKERTPYDETRYLDALRRRGSPLAVGFA